MKGGSGAMASDPMGIRTRGLDISINAKRQIADAAARSAKANGGVGADGRRASRNNWTLGRQIARGNAWRSSMSPGQHHEATAGANAFRGFRTAGPYLPDTIQSDQIDPYCRNAKSSCRPSEIRLLGLRHYADPWAETPRVLGAH
jgi:hypothetical protein